MSEKKPDYMDSDWSALIRDRMEKWDKMWETYAAQGLIPQPLWDGGGYQTPHRDGFTPRLLVYPTHPGEARGILIVCAGGGFLFESDNEAKPVADYFYLAGLNVAVLDYNTDPSKPIGDAAVAQAAGEDGLRAVRYIRAHAKEWNILPDKIAIGGFSAGGGVSGYAGTRFDAGDPEAEDMVERVSSRPDAVVLVYSAFSSHSVCAGAANRKYSFEEQQKALGSFGVDAFLRLDCPPFFVTQTCYDDPRDSYYLGLALANRGIPHEIHTFEEGPHGCGLYDGGHPDSPLYPHTALWAGVAADWLKMKGFWK